MHLKNPRQWHQYLQDIIDPLNKAPNRVTGVSPYKIIFGIPPQKIGQVKVQGETTECKARKKLYQMVYERSRKARLGYSVEVEWPILEKDEEVIVKYSGAKDAKEHEGTVIKYSGPENPRVDVFFPSNRKSPELGIHKGMIYKRSPPIPPLFHQPLEFLPQFPSIVLPEYTPIVDLRRSKRQRTYPNRLVY